MSCCSSFSGICTSQQVQSHVRFLIGSFITDGVDSLILIILSVCVIFILFFCVYVSVFVLRYLLPCNHVMLSQRRSIRETDMYGKSADKFLSLIPECCRLNPIHSTEQEEDGVFWGRGESKIKTPVSSVSLRGWRHGCSFSSWSSCKQCAEHCLAFLLNKETNHKILYATALLISYRFYKQSFFSVLLFLQY